MKALTEQFHVHTNFVANVSTFSAVLKCSQFHLVFFRIFKFQPLIPNTPTPVLAINYPQKSVLREGISNGDFPKKRLRAVLFLVSNGNCVGFGFCDWLIKLAPLSQPMKTKPKPIASCTRAFSRAFKPVACNCFRIVVGSLRCQRLL